MATNKTYIGDSEEKKEDYKTMVKEAISMGLNATPNAGVAPAITYLFGLYKNISLMLTYLSSNYGKSHGTKAKKVTRKHAIDDTPK